ncbi:hypothetical protein [Pseudonocardia sp. NPDC046786]|uniref:hypothetical protein n=1 Tax=Pseudonocardia sp. NPDC046786 TaxID=3155471 RepID=UPI00340B80DA
MTARFVLSLDCEGRWGMADRLTPGLRDALSDQPLREAYRGLLDLLDEFRMPATFAFVGLFSLDPRLMRELHPGVRELARHFPDYLGPALAELESPAAQGWHGDWAIEATRGARMPHELALHGATHVPWDHPAMTADLARRELALIHDAGIPLTSEATTYIYPRNAVAYPEVLEEFGIVGYRTARGRHSRIGSLLSEFDLTAPPDPDLEPSWPVRVPAGYFVNWLSGPRRAVPRRISVARVRNLLTRAADTGGVVHLWTHPENLATAPATLCLLRALLREVARMRDAGRCEVLTQAEYCRRLTPTPTT